MKQTAVMVALVVCLSAPAWAQIFVDGFESGDTCAWDVTQPMCGFCTDVNTLALWKFDETSGQTLFDSSGNLRHLTLGPTSAVEPDDPVRSQGRFDQGLFFESITSDYASGDGSNTFPSNELTLELWVRPTGGSGSGGVAQVFTAGFINCAMSTRTAANNVWFAIGSGTSWETVYGDVAGVDLDDGNWHYLAMTYDGNTLVGYIDGQLAASEPASTILASPSDYKIGGRPQNTFLDGWMDEVRLSDVARSAADIAGVWNGALQCP